MRKFLAIICFFFLFSCDFFQSPKVLPSKEQTLEYLGHVINGQPVKGTFFIITNPKILINGNFVKYSYRWILDDGGDYAFTFEFSIDDVQRVTSDYMAGYMVNIELKDKLGRNSIVSLNEKPLPDYFLPSTKMISSIQIYASKSDSENLKKAFKHWRDLRREELGINYFEE